MPYGKKIMKFPFKLYFTYLPVQVSLTFSIDNKRQEEWKLKRMCKSSVKLTILICIKRSAWIFTLAHMWDSLTVYFYRKPDTYKILLLIKKKKKLKHNRSYKINFKGKQSGTALFKFYQFHLNSSFGVLNNLKKYYIWKQNNWRIIIRIKILFRVCVTLFC